MAKILVIDDDKINVMFIRSVLERAFPDNDFLSVTSGKEALEIADDEKPDMILLDVLMPDISGFDVCRSLKKEEYFKSVPILMITGLDETGQKVKGFEAGASDYITKPINVDELKARVAAHLSIKKYHDELVRAQAALIESSKMSAVGTLAAGVAHEFNNILLMMSGYVQLDMESDDIEEIKKTLLIVQELITRGEKIVKGLLDFSRKDEYQKPTPTNLNDLLLQDIDLLKKELTKNSILLETNFADDLPTLDCFPGQISQVFINIIKNAIEAVEGCDEKRITIFSRMCNRSTDDCYQNECNLGLPCLQVVIEDTGRGISECVRDKIFEPFVTTKGVVGGGNDSSPGTGLGLSISYGIMQRHNGFILVKPRRSKGTKVILLFQMSKQDS